jgi:hypothetical protein
MDLNPKVILAAYHGSRSPRFPPLRVAFCGCRRSRTTREQVERHERSCLEAMGQAVGKWHHRCRINPAPERPTSQPMDMTRCLTEFNQQTTLLAVIELCLSGWLIAGLVPLYRARFFGHNVGVKRLR